MKHFIPMLCHDIQIPMHDFPVTMDPNFQSKSPSFPRRNPRPLPKVAQTGTDRPKVKTSFFWEKNMENMGNIGNTMDKVVGLLMKKDCQAKWLLIWRLMTKPNTAGLSAQLLLVDWGDSRFWRRTEWNMTSRKPCESIEIHMERHNCQNSPTYS